MSSHAAGLVAIAALTLSPLAVQAQSAPSKGVAFRPSILVAKVSFSSREDLNQLAEKLDLTAAVDNGNHTVEALLSQAEFDALVASGRTVEVLEEQTRLMNAPREDGMGRLGISGYACYRTVTETYAAMARLETTYPNLAEWKDIGDTWDKVTAGGNPGDDLRVLILTNKSLPGPKPRFFLMGGIHAREYTTAELATRFAEQLVTRYGTEADATWLLDHHELHVVVQANPDGRRIAETGSSKRKNANTSQGSCSTTTYGVDLNRNSSFDWGGAGASTSACNETYRGRASASEPETLALENYIRSIFPDQRGPGSTDAAPADATGLLLSLHSYGGYVLYPWGATTTPPPNATQLRTLGRKFNYFNGYQACQVASCLYAATGSTDAFSYGELGVASYTFEMGNAFFESCSAFENTILPKNLPALYYAFKAARRPYQVAAGPDAITLTVSASTVSRGTDVTLFARADDTRYGTNGGTEASQVILGARYSIDAPSWVSGTPTYAMNPVDGLFNSTAESVQATVFTSGLAPGRHTLFVEARDSQGNWGVPSAIFLNVQ
ncbi:M14 family metallopeptidase [Stigmatella aurantiaca]|uniref:Cpa1-prov protein, putative n=1 Tax=Stigmatella aurantiaca (strain DW4/3-1) TaxID=378806 RepID=Q09E18_STIAD|nr:M14 family metallopeptidase [Stigmatella aurantiaca]ADO74773.1 Peptidase M14, carboxypeptidase A [Stigmatella aurantiaca DW4/3-1]EAU70041.1 Cpa1-prov protein, putative [Stigmatella aurantiaca DW4/3-1]